MEYNVSYSGSLIFPSRLAPDIIDAIKRTFEETVSMNDTDGCIIGIGGYNSHYNEEDICAVLTKAQKAGGFGTVHFSEEDDEFWKFVVSEEGVKKISGRIVYDDDPEKKKLEHLRSAFESYVWNDYHASDAEYISEALSCAGCSDEDIRELGFGFAISEEIKED